MIIILRFYNSLIDSDLKEAMAHGMAFIVRKPGKKR
jgi:hypothetical protein